MTQEQYAQMMAQQQMAQQAQGPAMGGFMGGLLDSAIFGLLPNSLYENPQDPTNRDSAQLGGLLGMIIPALLGKWGGGALARNLATKIDPKTASGIARWMLGAGQGEAQAANALYRQDMLGGLLGGALGGGMAEGPLGMLLGAGIGGGATYMNRAENAGELGLMKMFEKTKVTPPTPELKNIVKATPEKAKTVMEKITGVYDKQNNMVKLVDIVDDLELEKITIGKIDIDGVAHKLTGKDLAIKAIDSADEKIVISKAAKKDGKGVQFMEPVETTYGELYKEFTSPLLTLTKHKKNPRAWIENQLGKVKQEGVDVGKVSEKPTIFKQIYNKLSGEGKGGIPRYANSYTADLKSMPNAFKYEAKATAQAEPVVTEEALRKAGLEDADPEDVAFYRELQAKQ